MDRQDVQLLRAIAVPHTDTRYRLRLPPDPAIAPYEAASHFDERHDLRGTGAQTGNDGLRRGGNRSTPLSKTVRKISVFQAAVAGEDLLRIGAAVAAGGCSRAHGVLKGGRPRRGQALH